MLKNTLNKLLILLALISTLTLSGCKKEIRYCCAIFDNRIFVAYSDKQGNDYLKTLSQETLSGIKLYHLVDGKKVYFNNIGRVSDNLVKPRYAGGPYTLNIPLPLPQADGDDVRTTAYLLWENGREDEIVGSFISKGDNQRIKKFWYNKEEASADYKEIYTYVIPEE
ncbi:hypothetical protein [Pedobacter gandavensis]|uniref:hypothetical protein n=1 Tax=Pedobacter gandavensis TaxID=2679963 RepID=UPI00292E3905|nr:hypothetical protein [Pedobacter gandavensis]